LLLLFPNAGLRNIETADLSKPAVSEAVEIDEQFVIFLKPGITQG